ncbi:helix-turn-helix domain-containing protein [Streptomonospora nanhaiensis]|uniref:helix-turn-helix domain-containing protein n=1 Tax=Streptomonospora nanhaiensis TaxID=1323731 RepID=UPI001C388289|nr:helix-turn-helix domain-containing protein [Streptomonospora nanhaiensis]MBV2366199.1 helix-turn-helix domain-containing protein [Streptomonospora nanhaiensis]
MHHDTPSDPTPPEHAQTIGTRLTELRNRRGLTQEALAEQTGLSVGVIRKIENARGGARMETYRLIADALGVETIVFAVPGSPAPQPSTHQDTALAEIRAAINPPAGMRGPIMPRGLDTPDLGMLADATKILAQHYERDEYDTVARMAPAVVRAAHLHVNLLDGDDQAAARRLRSDVLGVAGRWLIQVREHDLALVALRDALSDALAVDDTPRAARAISSEAWALLRQGRFAEVETLCSTSADMIEPSKITKASPDELSAWGWLLLRASAAAVRNNRPAEANMFHRHAMSAAAAVGREVRNPIGQTFGPMTVALKGPENALVSEKPDLALRLAEELPWNAGVSMRSDMHRHGIDKARAHFKLGHVDDAEQLLQELRVEAPEWLRHQQSARDAVEDMINDKKRRPSRTLVDLAKFLQVSL